MIPAARRSHRQRAPRNANRGSVPLTSHGPTIRRGVPGDVDDAGLAGLGLGGDPEQVNPGSRRPGGLVPGRPVTDDPAHPEGVATPGEPGRVSPVGGTDVDLLVQKTHDASISNMRSRKSSVSEGREHLRSSEQVPAARRAGSTETDPPQMSTRPLRLRSRSAAILRTFPGRRDSKW